MVEERPRDDARRIVSSGVRNGDDLVEVVPFVQVGVDLREVVLTFKPGPQRGGEVVPRGTQS